MTIHHVYSVILGAALVACTGTEPIPEHGRVDPSITVPVYKAKRSIVDVPLDGCIYCGWPDRAPPNMREPIRWGSQRFLSLIPGELR